MPASLEREEGGHRQPSTGRLARERDLAGVDALCEQSLVHGAGVVDRGRVRVLGRQPIVDRHRLCVRSPGEIAHQGHRRRRRTDDIDATVEVQDRVGGVDAPDRDVDRVHATDRRGNLLDIGGDRHVRHEVVERGSQGCDVGLEVEPPCPNVAINSSRCSLLIACSLEEDASTRRGRFRTVPRVRVAPRSLPDRDSPVTAIPQGFTRVRQEARGLDSCVPVTIPGYAETFPALSLGYARQVRLRRGHDRPTDAREDTPDGERTTS